MFTLYSLNAMANSLNTALSALSGSTVAVSPTDIPRDTGQAPVSVTFSSGPVLSAAYWRIITDGRAGTSSFDHEQIYGLPNAVDAVEVLGNTLTGKRLLSAFIEPSTGDLHFNFADHVTFQVFNFTGYEIWDIWFPDGAVEYSNYNK
jgi:hypothetical protein